MKYIIKNTKHRNQCMTALVFNEINYYLNLELCITSFQKNAFS
jgi:hypothetical protein